MKWVKQTWQELFSIPEGYPPQDEKVLRRCSSALKVGSAALIANAATVGIEQILHLPNQGIAENIRAVQVDVAAFAGFSTVSALIFRGAVEALNPQRRG